MCEAALEHCELPLTLQYRGEVDFAGDRIGETCDRRSLLVTPRMTSYRQSQ